MENENYYVMLGSERQGPMSLTDLLALAITPETPVWKPGMADWVKASNLPELAPKFAAPQPPTPPYQQPTGYPQPAQQPYNPGYSQPGYGMPGGIPPRPSNYLGWAIAATILCCLPAGVVGIVYSSQVNSKYDQGDYAGAESASNSAKTWIIVSAVVGFICGIIGFLGALADL